MRSPTATAASALSPCRRAAPPCRRARQIVDDTAYEKDERFLCILSEPTGGAVFRDDTDGRSERDICTITIESDGGVRTKVDRVMSLLNLNRQKQQLIGELWSEQLSEAVGLPEDQRGPSAWFMHALMLPWKLLFALTPPTEYYGGWVCFVVALIMIGIVTAVIGDLASLFGCCIGFHPANTAITFVAPPFAS